MRIQPQKFVYRSDGSIHAKLFTHIGNKIYYDQFFHPNGVSAGQIWYIADNNNNLIFHRDNYPAITKYDMYGQLESVEWYKHGNKACNIEFHNGTRMEETFHTPQKNYRIKYHPNGQISERTFLKDDYLHSYDDKPTIIAYYDDGKKKSECWILSDEKMARYGKLPGYIEYYRNGQASSMVWYDESYKTEYNELGWKLVVKYDETGNEIKRETYNKKK